MGKVKRLLCLFMAMVLLFTTFSSTASAIYTPYLDDAILNHYNSIDKAVLSSEQKASLLLDLFDARLKSKSYVLDLGALGCVDFSSVDNALSSVYEIIGGTLFTENYVGKFDVFRIHGKSIADVRRTSTEKTDLELINTVVEYLCNCIPEILSLGESGTSSWGVIKFYLPEDKVTQFKNITEEIRKYFWDELHPVNSEEYIPKISLDSLLQFICDNQLGAVPGGERAEIMGFNGILPGLSVDVVTENGYRFFDEVFYSLYNYYLVPLFNNEIKAFINEFIAQDTYKGGKLYNFINVDYTVSEYPFETSLSFSRQLNYAVGFLVKDMTFSFNWKYDTVTGQTDAEVLVENLTNLISEIISYSSETHYSLSGKTFDELLGYFLPKLINYYASYSLIPGETSALKTSYYAIKSYCSYIIPEREYPEFGELADESSFRDVIEEMLTDIAIFYCGNYIGIDFDIGTSTEEFLGELALWAAPYFEGFVDMTEFHSTSNGWLKIDSVIWQLIPKDWFPYSEMFAEDGVPGSEDQLTFQSLVNYILDMIINCDVEAFYKLLARNNSGTLEIKSISDNVFTLICNLINAAFLTSTGQSCIPDGVAALNDFIEPYQNLEMLISNIACEIPNKLDTLVSTIINLIIGVLDADNDQTMVKAEISIDEKMYCENGLLPSGQTIKISNMSKGVNRAYSNVEGELIQDGLYHIEILLLTVYSNTIYPSSIPSITRIAPNDCYEVSLHGTISASETIRFELRYDVVDGTGNRINKYPLMTTTFCHFYSGERSDEVMSPEISATNNVSFDAFPQFLYTTDVNELSAFSVIARNNSYTDVSEHKDVRKVYITGSLPEGITLVNDPNNPIVDLPAPIYPSQYCESISPYVVSHDSVSAYPYGVYNLMLSFEVTDHGTQSGVITEQREHIIIIYNDFGLPELLEEELNKNRQMADYVDDMDEESVMAWDMYMEALKSAYSLLHGNPLYKNMFTTMATIPYDCEGNAYNAAVCAINEAVAFLEQKMLPTDSELLQNLSDTVDEQTRIHTEDKFFDTVDYELYSYNRWNMWRNQAMDIINLTEPVPNFELVYTQYMLELLYPRMIKKDAVTTHLETDIDYYGNEEEAYYTDDSWIKYKQALDSANEASLITHEELRQSNVNALRKDLRSTFFNLKPRLLYPISAQPAVINSEKMYINGIDVWASDISYYFSVPIGLLIETKFSSSTNRLGTGTYIVIKDMNNDVFDTYCIILYGDVNGDGNVNGIDVDMLRLVIQETDDYLFFKDSPWFRAADLDVNGVLNEDDLYRLELDVIEGDKINQIDPRL